CRATGAADSGKDGEGVPVAGARTPSEGWDADGVRPVARDPVRRGGGAGRGGREVGAYGGAAVAEHRYGADRGGAAAAEQGRFGPRSGADGPSVGYQLRGLAMRCDFSQLASWFPDPHSSSA